MKKPSRKNIRPQLIAMGRHLVYSEGTKTEPYYVSNLATHIKKDISNRNVLICKKFSKTSHTLALISKVETDIEKERRNGRCIDGVWILFDKDSFDDFDEATATIESKNFMKNMDGIYGDEYGTVGHSCYSNECFEVWPYLHYEDLVSPISRRLYIQKIDAFIKSKGFSAHYKKNIKELYDFLLTHGGNVNKAISLAKKKDVGKGNKKINPSTAIYELVSFFMAYFDK